MANFILLIVSLTLLEVNQMCFKEDSCNYDNKSKIAYIFKGMLEIKDWNEQQLIIYQE